MKKFLLWILAAIASVCMIAGCGASDKESGATYTVTFCQAGCEDIVKTVSDGGDLTDVPTPQTKKGYTVTWSQTTFDDITQDLLVTAVATPNEYTITYDANGGSVEPATQVVVYDSTPVLATPTRDGFTFTNWTYDGKGISEKWTIAQDVTLKAQWVENTPNYYSITFVQEGQENIVIENVLEGTDYTAQVPTPKSVTGYNVAWRVEDLAKLANVQENVVVTAQATAKTYTLNLTTEQGTIAQPTMTVIYGEVYTLPKLADTKDYLFKGWKIGNDTIASTGTWSLDSAATYTLQAVWEEVAPPDLDDDENWTDNY